MKKAVAYIRVSTIEQAVEGISLDNQIGKIQDYANLNDMNVVKIVKDAGKSGKTLNREGIQELISFCGAKEIEAVIVYQFSRLTRSTKDLLYLVEDIFEKNGVAFHSINEKVDTSTPQGKFFLTIIGAMNQMEREEIAFRTKDALAHKKEKGEKIGGTIPMGYRVVEETGRKILVENADQSRTIELVKSLRAGGMNTRRIAIEMERRTILTATGKARWYPMTVKRILAS
jgi:DNA invertase Pin-like site-specific DNA recombinase